ncbi:hypothetical protein [Streptomyces sp. SPB162]|nr:hypothetical protein [Streptomyces sp. SPB162]
MPGPLRHDESHRLPVELPQLGREPVRECAVATDDHVGDGAGTLDLLRK